MKHPKYVLWLSRHKMSPAQREDLVTRLGSEVTVTQINANFKGVDAPLFGMPLDEADKGLEPDFLILGEHSSLGEIAKDFDELAVVLPTEAQAEVLTIKNSLLIAVSKRIITEEGKAAFVHDKWKRVLKVEIVSFDL